METLTSEKNPLLKEVRKAAARGTLTDDGFAVAEGFHLLDEALGAGCQIQAVIASEAVTDRLPNLKAARLISVPDAIFRGLATTETPQGVIALVRPPAWTLDDLLRGDALIVALDGIQDPGNAGAILRAAEAFGATGAIFLKGTVSPYNPKAIRGSAGSVFRVPIAIGNELPDLPLYAATPRAAKTPADVDLRTKCVIVIGSEGRGVSPVIADRATGIRIPTVGVESLNAAVAAGVLLYEARRQRTSALDHSGASKRSEARR